MAMKVSSKRAQKREEYIQQCMWYALKDADFNETAAYNRLLEELTTSGYNRTEIDCALQKKTEWGRPPHSVVVKLISNDAVTTRNTVVVKELEI